MLRRYGTLKPALLLALAYFITARLGLSLGSVSGVAASVWPPTGISLAALILWGSDLWPGVAAGAFLVNYSLRLPFWVAAGMACGNTIEALVAVHLLRSVDFRPALDRLADVLALMIRAALVSTLFSATIGVTSGWLGGVISTGHYRATWWSWWVGDAMGDLVVAPLLLTAVTFWKSNSPITKRVEGVALLLGLMVLLTTVFTRGSAVSNTVYPGAYVVFPFLIWAALRFGSLGVSVVLGLTSIVAVCGTVYGFGPFARSVVQHSLLHLQTFLGVAASTGLALAAVMLERKRATVALRESEERYRRLVEISPEAILLADVTAQILLCNEQAATLCGYPRHEMIGKNGFDLLSPEEQERAGEGLRRTLAEGRIKDVEYVLLRKDGSRFCAEISAAVIRGSLGEANALMVVIRDITQRREMEGALRGYTAALEASNRELEAFSYSVSHDLRNHLEAIYGYTDLLATDCAKLLDDSGRSYLEGLRSAGERMNEVIDGLLRLGYIARAPLQREVVDLSGLAEDVAADLRRRDPKRQLDFAIVPEIKVAADARLLRVVIENLFGNAWKFTQGEVAGRIELATVRVGDENAYVVRDNGVGFDSADNEKLFKAFERLQNASEFPGSGIGLATVQRVIERHGGRVWAEGSIGWGAAFYFTLGESDADLAAAVTEQRAAS